MWPENPGSQADLGPAQVDAAVAEAITAVPSHRSGVEEMGVGVEQGAAGA
ncbi:hypothetical protein HaLaN_02489, partial [Haematococcus lacustris]